LFQNPAVEGSWKDDRYNDPSNQPGYIALGIMRTQEQLDEWMSRYPDYTVDGEPLQLGMIYYKDVRGEEYIDSVTGKIAYLPRTVQSPAMMSPSSQNIQAPPIPMALRWASPGKGLRASGVFTGAFGHKVSSARMSRRPGSFQGGDQQRIQLLEGLLDRGKYGCDLSPTL